ncbi:hypothetical protein AMATHDRAFT_148079 [Amanita thiersii Skay4041]|uniref:GPI inositol-deacylase n=1 Tax=Amanita thiersii Skay4041 TaxID=703135 RepID=A0A2A9NNJ6_9AGAR|nr:hypothetical protein AMATHDRAFT_148079 [Amanita thiersii Skay4041]
MLTSVLPIVLALFTVFALLVSYSAYSDISHNLSPQGCRMSWMSPSYLLQSQFNKSWTPLGNRYSLWLYREFGWDPNEASSRKRQLSCTPSNNHVRNSLPVLFIPGNAGSSHQVRSIASSATRQFFSSPQAVSSTFSSRKLKRLDFYAVEFNEDLSAFHGPTLQSQVAYTSRAIDYILSLYPANTSIIVMGHSMGGIVATSLLPADHISAAITMSTPHTLPPARFDARIDEIYQKNLRTLMIDSTPIVSLCGGAMDMMIPSESCVLPPVVNKNIYRRTVFTSALEGSWTGVGHREMVWCHQVRWRIARAALELGAANSPESRGVVLDKWLRDGGTLPPSTEEYFNTRLQLTDKAKYEVLPEELQLVVKTPIDSKMYLLPVPQKATNHTKFILLVSQGSIGPISPQNPLPLTVSVFTCSSIQSTPECQALEATTLRLIPNPNPAQPFPLPAEGSDESEGVALYEAHAAAVINHRWIGIQINNGDGRGWVVGGFDNDYAADKQSTTLSLLAGHRSRVNIRQKALSTEITIPGVRQNALLVYRLEPEMTSSACDAVLFAPLLVHTAQPIETHFFPLYGKSKRRILLHSHGAAPYVESWYASHQEGLKLTIYSSAEPGCTVKSLDLQIDWSATLGRWVSRYPTTIVIWAAGITSLLMFWAWGVEDRRGILPTVGDSLSAFSSRILPRLLLCSMVLSLFPLPVRFYLGNGGEPLFSVIAPLLLIVSTGLVYISWIVLTLVTWVIGRMWVLFHRKPFQISGAQRGAATSMAITFLFIFLFIPWQVAFLGAWMIQLYTCSLSTKHSQQSPVPQPYTRETYFSPTPGDAAVSVNDPTPSISQSQQGRRSSCHEQLNNLRHNWYLLLLMTWLLPLAAPTLAVWVRTLGTAGYSTPFDGDHNFLIVAPFLILVDLATWVLGPLLTKYSFEDKISVRWTLAIISLTAFLIGSRRPYDVFNAASISLGLIVITRVGRRYLGI